MNSEPKPTENQRIDQRIDHLRNATRDAVKDIDLTSLSPAGFLELEKSITTYVRELIVLAVQQARRERLDGVSASHVELAAARLIVRPKARIWQYVGGIGGIFLGTAVSNIAAIVDRTASNFSIVLTVILTAIGAAMLTLQASRDGTS